LQSFFFTLTTASVTAGNDLQICVKSDYESGVQMAERGDLNMALIFSGRAQKKAMRKACLRWAPITTLVRVWRKTYRRRAPYLNAPLLLVCRLLVRCWVSFTAKGRA
jgi:hypothetical protein